MCTNNTNTNGSSSTNKKTIQTRLLLIPALLLILQQDITKVDACYWGCEQLNDHQMKIYSMSCANDSNINYFIRTTNTHNRKIDLTQCHTTKGLFIRVECLKNYTQHDYLMGKSELYYYKNNNKNSMKIIRHSYTIVEPQLESCLKHTVYNLTSVFLNIPNNKNDRRISVLLSWQTMKWDKETFVRKTIITKHGKVIQTLEAGNTKYRIDRMQRCRNIPVCIQLESKYRGTMMIASVKATPILTTKCITIATPCDPMPYNNGDDTTSLKPHEIVLIIVGVVIVIGIIVFIVFLIRTMYVADLKLKLSRKPADNNNLRSDEPVDQRQLQNGYTSDSVEAHHGGDFPTYTSVEVYDHIYLTPYK